MCWSTWILSLKVGVVGLLFLVENINRENIMIKLQSYVPALPLVFAMLLVPIVDIHADNLQHDLDIFSENSSNNTGKEIDSFFSEGTGDKMDANAKLDDIIRYRIEQERMRVEAERRAYIVRMEKNNNKMWNKCKCTLHLENTICLTASRSAHDVLSSKGYRYSKDLTKMEKELENKWAKMKEAHTRTCKSWYDDYRRAKANGKEIDDNAYVQYLDNLDKQINFEYQAELTEIERRTVQQYRNEQARKKSERDRKRASREQLNHAKEIEQKNQCDREFSRNGLDSMPSCQCAKFHPRRWKTCGK